MGLVCRNISRKFLMGSWVLSTFFAGQFCAAQSVITKPPIVQNANDACWACIGALAEDWSYDECEKPASMEYYYRCLGYCTASQNRDAQSWLDNLYDKCILNSLDDPPYMFEGKPVVPR